MLKSGDAVKIITNNNEYLGEGIIERIDENTWMVFIAFADRQILPFPYSWLQKQEKNEN